MTFSLDLIRARKGDCFLLHFGAGKKRGLVVVDGGPKTVYASFLKHRLEAIRGDKDSLKVDLMMVSHIDDDHIQGILDLTREEIEADDARRPKLLNVQRFWHNSFDAIIGHKPDELTASVSGQFGPASVAGAGHLDEDKVCEVADAYEKDNPDEVDLEPVESSLKVLASIEQGYVLRLNAERLRYPRNPEFDGGLVMVREGGGDARGEPIGHGLTLTVVGPRKAEIDALYKKHQAWLSDLKKKGKSPPQQLAAYLDKSVPNLSSIVVLAECEGKSMLLTGDARGDKILEGLEAIGRLQTGGTLKVDLLKVPHHGSANNLDQDFFRRIRADHYVFSGDGEHGNPERDAFEMLFAARGSDPLTIHLTYPVAEIDAERKKDWAKEQAKERARGKAKARPNWSAARHGLAAFFARRPLADGQSVRIVEEGKPHLITVT